MNKPESQFFMTSVKEEVDDESRDLETDGAWCVTSEVTTREVISLQ